MVHCCKILEPHSPTSHVYYRLKLESMALIYLWTFMITGKIGVYCNWNERGKREV